MNTKPGSTSKRGNRPTSDYDIMRIKNAHENGLRALQISNMLNIKLATVYGIIKKYKGSWEIEANNLRVCNLRESELEQGMWQICRFCLSQEEETLEPMVNILNAYLTIDDVERFTGISIHLNSRIMDAICPDCTNILQNAVRFRLACISNDAYLREQIPLDDSSDPLEMGNNCRVFKTYEPSTTVQGCDSRSIPKTKKTSSGRKKNLVDVKEVSNSNIEMEPPAVQKSDSRPQLHTKHKLKLADAKKEHNSADCTEPGTSQDFNNPLTLNATNAPDLMNVEEEFYSANYIEPGERTRSDNEEHESDEASISSFTSSVQSSTKKMCVYKDGSNLFNVAEFRIRKRLCSMCGKFVQNLEHHIATHTKEAKHACPHCPVRMVHEANLTRHINAVHLKLITKTCELCGKGVTSKSALLSHMRSAHGIGKWYQCTVCTKKYSHPSGLRDHKRTHGVQQNFKCEICGMEFIKRKSLKAHQAVHSSIKPYECSECPKRFKSSYAKVTHQLTHSGTVFKCTMCNKSYRYKSLLNIHLRKMHTSNDDGKE